MIRFRRIGEVRPGREGVSSLALRRDAGGPLLVAGWNDGSLLACDVPGSGTRRFSASAPDLITAVCAHADAPFVYVGCRSGDIVAFEPNPFAVAAWSAGPPEPDEGRCIGGMAWCAPIQGLFVTRVYGFSLVDPRTFEPRWLGYGDMEGCFAVAVSGDGRRVAAGGMAGTRVFDTGGMALVAMLPHPGPEGLALSFDGTRAAVAPADRPVELWEVPGPRPVAGLAAEQSRSTASGLLEFSADGRLLVWDDGSGTIGVFDAEDGSRVAEIPGRSPAAILEDFSLLACGDGSEGDCVSLYRLEP